MAIEVLAAEVVPDGVEVIGVAFFKDVVAASSAVEVDTSVLIQLGFEGNLGQVQVLPTNGKVVIAVGLGRPADVKLDQIRKAAAAFTRAAWKYEFGALLLGTDFPGLTAQEIGQAMAEGVVLAGYRYDEFKSKPDAPKLRKMSLVGADAAGVHQGSVIAGAVNMARDLVNGPPGSVTPIRLAEVASEVAERTGLAITVLDEQAIESERLGGLRGVSMGSDQPPRLIELTYEPPEGFSATVALVGKGITFDSGGLSLKPPDGMMTMKTDMSGAAAVIAAMSTLSELAPRVKVIGIVCATENLPGPKATKPGDVLRARNGKTMEVLNTDAEGRLVLADGLSLAVEADVDAIVDVATLTGACVVALGGEIAGLMGNDDDLREQVQRASVSSGEPLWHLPLPERYRKHIDSEIADMKNIGAGKGAAGTLTAGLFLQEFVGDTAWVHLDIAGPARSESDDGYIAKGGTAFGTRTLIELVRNYKKPA